MSCKEYISQVKDWVADATLGELRPERETELLAHLAECAACREACEHARNVSAAVNRGVESLLSGEPSAQFALRLRARLAEETARQRSPRLWTLWAPFAGAATAFALLLLILLPRSTHTKKPNPVAPVPPQSQSAPPLALALNPPPRTVARPPVRPLRVSPPPSLGRRTASASRAPEVLVEPGEFAAIEAYAVALNSGQVAGASTFGSELTRDKRLEIKPIEIAPLEAPDSPASPGATPDTSRP